MFDDNNGTIRVLLRAKNEAHAAKLRNPHSAALHDKWKDLRSTAQRELRHMENQGWIEKAHQIQQYADNNELQKFYEAIKEVYGPRHTFKVDTLGQLKNIEAELNSIKEGEVNQIELAGHKKLSIPNKNF